MPSPPLTRSRPPAFRELQQGHGLRAGRRFPGCPRQRRRASAPIPRSGRPSTPSRNSMAVNDVTTVIAKSGQGGMIANSAALRLQGLSDNGSGCA